MFGDIAVTFYVDDVVVADEQHRARRLFGGVDACDKRLQFIERTLQRRIDQLKMSGVFTKIRKLCKFFKEPFAGRALRGALRNTRQRDKFFYHR